MSTASCRPQEHNEAFFVEREMAILNPKRSIKQFTENVILILHNELFKSILVP